MAGIFSAYISKVTEYSSSHAG